MKTALVPVALLVILLGSHDLTAGVLVKNQDGTTIVIEDWSKPETIEIPSGERKVQVVCRRCEVLQTGLSGLTTKHEVEMLFEPKSRELWLGMPESKHVMLRGRIFGVRPAYGKLVIAKSSRAADVEGGEEAIAEEFFRKVAQEPVLSVWLDQKGMSRLDLERVFGDVILPKGDPRIVRDSVEIVSISSSSDAMVLSMTTLAGHKLRLTLNENLEILEAKKDGQPFLVLFNGRGGAPKGHKFNGSSLVNVSTQRGTIQAIVGSREYSLVGADGEEIGSSTVIAAVMPDTGELWIGPAPCKLARLEGGVVGFLVENKNELWIIRDQGVRIPAPPAGVAVFDDALQRFSADFESHKRQWSPYLKVNLSQIVQASGLISKGWEFWVDGQGSSFEGNSLLLRLGTSNTRTKVEVSLSSDLKLQSSRVVKSE